MRGWLVKQRGGEQVARAFAAELRAWAESGSPRVGQRRAVSCPATPAHHSHPRRKTLQLGNVRQARTRITFTEGEAMNADGPHASVVSRVRAVRAKRKVSRAVTRRILLSGGAVAAGAAVLAPTPVVRAVSLTTLLAIAIGAAISWLAGPGAQLTASGREMGEDSQD